MTSIRKRLSIAFGHKSEGSPSTSEANSMDVHRSSVDSGYHSMIAKPERESQDGLSRVTTFVNSGTESSPERSPRKLRKAISTTFSGAIQAFSNTVRSTTSFIYPTPGEPELPSSEWAECETPKKPSRRSSIMSSVRSRKQRFTPRASDVKNESLELPPSSVPVTEEKAPALDVDIPNPSFSYESLGRTSGSRGSQLLAGVKLPAGSKNLWPGPTRLTADQASCTDRRKIPRPVSSTLDDPYVEQGVENQHGLSAFTSALEFAMDSASSNTKKHYLSDDKGYFSEVESNAEVSESDELSPVCLKHVAPGSPEGRTSIPYCHKDPAASHVHLTSSAPRHQETVPSQICSLVPLRLESSKQNALEGTAKLAASLKLRSQTFSNHRASLEADLDALLSSCEDPMTSKSRLLDERLPSDVYDADSESLESSMGSRAAWERHRADRERRYMEIIDTATKTESDEELRPELELKRSPSKKPVRYAEEMLQDSVNIGESDSTPIYPNGDLRYAVEAIERAAFPIGDLVYAMEATERPSVTTFDPLETVFQQRLMLPLSDTTDKQDTETVSSPPDSSQSRVEILSSSPADLSPSRVKLPSSPESSPADTSPAPNYTMMSIRFTDENFMTSGVGSHDSQSIRHFSSESTDVSTDSSPEQPFRSASEDAYEAGLPAGSLSIPTYLSSSTEIRPMEDDAYEAALGAPGVFVPIHPSDVVQARPAMDHSHEDDLKDTSLFPAIYKETGHGTYCEQLETESTMPESQSRNGTPFEHSRTVSAFSEDTDDSCAITTHSPSCNAPPPFPSLHVRSKRARCIPSVIAGLAAHGDEQIRIAGPANTGINPSLPSPFDDLGDQIGKAESKLFSPKTVEGANSPDDYAQVTWLEQVELQSPSPGNASSLQSPSNSGTPQEMFNAAKLPSFVSPSPIASRKARRKQKKRSSVTGTVTCTDNTTSPRNFILELDFSPSKRELSKSSTIGRTQTSLIESARIAGGRVQKPSPKHQLDRKKRFGRDPTFFEEFTEMVGDSVTRLDPSLKSKLSTESIGGKVQATATLSMTSSPQRMNSPQAKGKASSDEIRENAGSAVKGSKSRLEPELSTQHFDLTGTDPYLHVNHKLGSTSCAGHELDSILLARFSVVSRHELEKALQQDSDNKVAHSVSGDETIGNDTETDKDIPRTPSQKKKHKPPLEAEKKFRLQKEFEPKPDRARSRLGGKLKSGTLGEDRVREDDSPHKEGRPPWRP